MRFVRYLRRAGVFAAAALSKTDRVRRKFMSTKIEFRRVASELLSNYLKHQSWKAHEGLFMPLSFELEKPAA